MSDSDDEFFVTPLRVRTFKSRNVNTFMMLFTGRRGAQRVSRVPLKATGNVKTVQRRNFIELTVPEIDLLCNAGA